MARPPLDGSVALVTGASAGIGREIARLLAGRVRALVLVARRGDRLAELAAELTARRPDLSVHVQACDLGDLPATARMIAAVERDVGPVDVLVNNAGFGDFAFLERAAWDKLERMIRLNVVALAYLTHRVLGGMVARRRGGILNVSSGLGLSFMPGFAAYTGTKHFVTGFTEALRLEARPAGVVVSQLCPGPVETEFQAAAGMDGTHAPAVFAVPAARVARIALAGFARGRALIVPGLLMRIGIALGALAPRWLQRLFLRPVATRLRRLSGA